MEAPIGVEDIRGTMERPLTADEVRVIPNWISKAWEKLLDVVPDVSERQELPPTDPRYVRVNVVKDVLVETVERKVRNASGLRSFGTDEYQQQVDSELSSGKIYISAESLERFQPRPIAGTSEGAYSLQLEM